MSLQAMAAVIGSHEHRYSDGSASAGAQFVVELMIADSVNEQNHNVFWMSNENLARKARVTRETANRCVNELAAAGVLEHQGWHQSGVVKWKWCGWRRGVTTDHTCDDTSQGGVTTNHKGCDDKSHKPKTTQEEPKSGTLTGKESATRVRQTREALKR